MGHHLAQGGQAFTPQEFLFQALPFPKVPEMAHQAYLSLFLVEWLGG
jgi:hypothetical protein